MNICAAAIARAHPRPPLVLVALPAFNEEESLRALLPRVVAATRTYAVAIVVIDDASEDGTARTAASLGAFVLRKNTRQGLSNSIRLAFDLVQRVGASYLVTLDADGQHRPEELDLVLGPVIAGRADLCSGSRIRGRARQTSSLRRVGLLGLSWLMRVLVRHEVSDCACGLRAYRVSTLRHIRLTHPKHYAAESIISALAAGLRYEEVPVHVDARSHGATKQSSDVVYGLRFTRVMLGAWLRHSFR